MPIREEAFREYDRGQTRRVPSAGDGGGGRFRPGALPMVRPGKDVMTPAGQEHSWRRPGPAFETRVVTVAGGCSRAYDADEWRDAIVVIECGEVELETSTGVRRTFGSGAILWLEGLSLRALNNRGSDPVVLVAVSRRA